MAEIVKYYKNGIEFILGKDNQVQVNSTNIGLLFNSVAGINAGAYVANGYITPLKMAASGVAGNGKVLTYNATTQNFQWQGVNEIEDLTVFKVDGSRVLTGDLNLGGNQIISTTIVEESLGAELITDPTFDIGNSWARTNAVISGGVATITVTNGSGGNILQGGKTFEVGSTYELSFDVTGQSTNVDTDITTKKIVVLDNTGNSGGLISPTTDTFLTGNLQRLTFRFVANANSNAIQITRGVNSGNYTITVDNATLKKVNLASINNEVIEVPNGLTIGGVRVPTKTVGTTAERPLSPIAGDEHLDLTLGYRIDFNGTNWVDGTGTIR